VYSQRSGEKVEVAIHLIRNGRSNKAPNNDPSKVIETAIRQWLRGERDRDDELTRTLERNPPVPSERGMERLIIKCIDSGAEDLSFSTKASIT
jgi:hypothetical protein